MSIPRFTTQNVLQRFNVDKWQPLSKNGALGLMVRDGLYRLMAVPGVLDAGASNCLPLQGCFGMDFDVLGRPIGLDALHRRRGFFSISWSYFSTFQIPLLRGRAFSEQD